MCDPHARLIRLVGDHAGPDALLTRADVTPWRSATFTGEHHRIVFSASAFAAARLLALQAERLRIPGHLLVNLDVADGALDDGRRQVEIVALTLERN